MNSIKMDKIYPNDEQVRKSWDEEGIAELAESIKSEGLIVPIKVRPTDNNHYEIVYGHRRYAAALLAGLDEIEAIVVDVDDNEQLSSSMIENMVREDMNAADISDGLQQIKRETGKNWEEIGAMFGRTKWWATRIGNISDTEKKIIRSSGDTTLTAEHIKKIHDGIKDEKYRILILEKVGKEGLSTRQAGIVAANVNYALKNYGEKGAKAELARDYFEMNPNINRLETEEEIRGAFSWFKDKEVSLALHVFQNFNNTITRLMDARTTDPKVARKILTTMRQHLVTYLARIPRE